MAHDLFGDEIKKDVLLRERFMEPPFTILDARGGAWKARKRIWMSKGIKSEVGREGVDDIGMHGGSKETAEEWEARYGRKQQSFVSIFDPALTELMYRWFCPEGGLILDPFAGGSVRGIVANYIGFKYTGVDIRKEQIDSNREQAIEILELNNQPQWYVGDSNIEIDKLIEAGKEYDFVFSCPPYADLEVYSDLPGDISNKNYFEFLELYGSIIDKCIQALKPGGLAAFVVGDIRDKKTGYYRDFISHTKHAFIEAGAPLYNELILLQPLGTAMLRATRSMEATRKVTKVHENVLVFKKPEK